MAAAVAPKEAAVVAASPLAAAAVEAADKFARAAVLLRENRALPEADRERLLYSTLLGWAVALQLLGSLDPARQAFVDPGAGAAEGEEFLDPLAHSARGGDVRRRIEAALPEAWRAAATKARRCLALASRTRVRDGGFPPAVLLGTILLRQAAHEAVPSELAGRSLAEAERLFHDAQAVVRGVALLYDAEAAATGKGSELVWDRRWDRELDVQSFWLEFARLHLLSARRTAAQAVRRTEAALNLVRAARRLAASSQVGDAPPLQRAALLADSSFPCDLWQGDSAALEAIALRAHAAQQYAGSSETDSLLKEAALLEKAAARERAPRRKIKLEYGNLCSHAKLHKDRTYFTWTVFLRQVASDAAVGPVPAAQRQAYKVDPAAVHRSAISQAAKSRGARRGDVADEEPTASPREGLPEAFFLGGDDASLRLNDLVKRVTVELHPSFGDKDVVLLQPPFCFSRTGWGGFPIVLQVEFKHPFQGKSMALAHDLALDVESNGSSRVVELSFED